MEGSSFLKRMSREYSNSSQAAPTNETFLQRMQREERERNGNITEEAPPSASGKLPEFSGILGTLGIVNNMADVDHIVGRIKSIGEIGVAIAKRMVGSPISENQQKLVDTTIEGQKNALLGRVEAGIDLGLIGAGMPRDFNLEWDKNGIKATAKTNNVNLDDVVRSIGELTTGLKSTFTDWRNLPKIPMQMITAMASDAAKQATGVTMAGEELKALTPEQVNHAAKTTYANIMAGIMTPVVEEVVTAAGKRAAYRGIGGGAEATVASPIGGTMNVPGRMAEASQEYVSKISGKEIGPIRKIGESIIRDAAVAAGVGGAQGAMANAGDPSKQAASFIAALQFAPIGVITGLYRGIKGREGISESIIDQAKDVKAWRDWQEMSAAGLDQVVGKSSDLITAEKITEIAGKAVGDIPKVEDMFKEFEKHLEDATKPKQTIIGYDPGGESVVNFRKALLGFSLKHNLVDNLPQLTKVFTDKYYRKYAPKEMAELDALNHAINVEKKLLESKGFQSFDIIDAANERGFFVTNEHGALRIRDVESGKTVATAKTTQEAMEFLQNSGTVPNAPEFDMHSSLPSLELEHTVVPALHPWQETVAPQPFPRSEGIKIGGRYVPDIDRVEPSVRSAKTDLSFGALTGANAYFEAVDKIHGTNFTRGFRRLEEAHRKTLASVKGELDGVRVRLASKFLEASKITEHELEMMGMAIETKATAELEGLSHATTKELAQHAIKNDVDLGMVLRYRRQIMGLKSSAINKARTLAREQFDTNLESGMEYQEAFETMRASESQWEKSDYYIDNFNAISDQFKPDQNFMRANELYDALGKVPNGIEQMQLAMRLKNAYENPEHYGLSQDDFIKHHNLRPEQVKGVKMIEELYKHYGDKFGIGDLHRIDGYMPHYRAVSDYFDEAMRTDIERGIMDPSLRQFVSTMIRTGEVANYSKNPWKNLQSYIRGGVKNEHLYPTMNEEFGLGNDVSMRKEIEKLRTINSKEAEAAQYRVDAYSRDISGQASMSKRQAMALQARILSHFTVDENGNKLTLETMMKKLEEPEMIDTMMNLQSAAYLGGVPSLGLRDVIDVAIKYYTKYGAKAASELLRTKVPKERVRSLLASGDIVNPEGADIYNPTDNPNAASKAHQLTREIANRGYDASFQHYFYLRNQAAVYEHTLGRVHTALKKVQTGILTKEKMFEELGVNGYNDYTKAQFNAFVHDEHWGAAARLLAHEEVRDMVGYYTRGNQPPILNSTTGKLFGHMGSWAMTNRSVIQNILTRGTSKELAGKWARYGIANGAIVATGYATGLNLGRWLLLPTSLVVTGGPLVNAFKAFGSEAQAELGGDNVALNFTRRAAATAAKGFIPGAAAASNIVKAVDLVQNGSGYGVVKPVLQAFGVPVVKNPQNGLDVWLGNQPISWPDPTPFNMNPFNPFKPINLNPF